MRTTVTLEADVAKQLRDERRRTGRGFKDLLNAALRAGLSSRARPKEPLPPIRIRAHRCGAFRPGIDPGRLNQLYDQLEVETIGPPTRRRRPSVRS